MPTKDSVLAFMRHVYTALGMAGAVAIALGMLDQAQLDQVMAAVKTIGGSSGDIIAAIGVLVALLNAYRAARSASPANQIKTVDAMPNVTVVPLNPAGKALMDSIQPAPPPLP